MASTRSKNTPGNFCLEQRENRNSLHYLLYPHSAYGTTYDTKLAGFGFNPGNMPASTLSKNYINIESGLFGINSTNLVNPADPIVPDLYHLSSKSLIEKGPTFIPMPLHIEPHQRPNFD
jgi:hypothetical protein